MASSIEYVNYLTEELSFCKDISYRKMMGEYVIYYRQKVIGGIYDNRFLIKPVDSAKQMLPNASFEIPYPGAKPMILMENLEDKAFLQNLFERMFVELPEKKKK